MKNLLNFLNNKILKNKKLLTICSTFAFLFLCLPATAHADPNNMGAGVGLVAIWGLSLLSSVGMIILSSIAIYFKTPRFLYILSFLNGLLFFFFGYFNFLSLKDAFEVFILLPIIVILLALSFALLAYIDFHYAHKLIPFKIIYWIISAVLIIIPFSPVIYDFFVHTTFYKAVNAQKKTYTAIENSDLAKFLKAIDQGNLDILKSLIEQGADVNVKDNDSKTPLHYAIEKENKEIAELLITNGADVNAKDHYGETPLHYSIYEDKEIVELLIAKGADANVKDDHGKTPLHHTARYGYKDISALLIDSSADVNAKDYSGWTPLYYAVKEGNKEIVELLIAKGADVNIKVASYNLTALNLAKDEDMKQLLISHGAKSGKDLK